MFFSFKPEIFLLVQNYNKFLFIFVFYSHIFYIFMLFLLKEHLVIYQEIYAVCMQTGMSGVCLRSIPTTIIVFMYIATKCAANYWLTIQFCGRNVTFQHPRVGCLPMCKVYHKGVLMSTRCGGNLIIQNQNGCLA